ncbi:MAG: hypothetical protein M3O22_01595 [Pseudomonadota bacterium]|nr:hypothetical protein [Pseudomonadota bacterium]
METFRHQAMEHGTGFRSSSLAKAMAIATGMALATAAFVQTRDRMQADSAAEARAEQDATLQLLIKDANMERPAQGELNTRPDTNPVTGARLMHQPVFGTPRGYRTYNVWGEKYATEDARGKKQPRVVVFPFPEGPS